MCKNSEIISHLAKMKNREVLQALESKERPTWTKTFFVCLHSKSTYSRPWGDTMTKWERPLSRSRITLFNIVSTLGDWQCLYLFFLSVFFSPTAFLESLNEAARWALSLLHKLPLVVCRGFGVCQPICHFQHGALLQSSVDSRWTKEWMLNITTAPSCAPQRTRLKKNKKTTWLQLWKTGCLALVN